MGVLTIKQKDANAVLWLVPGVKNRKLAFCRKIKKAGRPKKKSGYRQARPAA